MVWHFDAEKRNINIHLSLFVYIINVRGLFSHLENETQSKAFLGSAWTPVLSANYRVHGESTKLLTTATEGDEIHLYIGRNILMPLFSLYFQTSGINNNEFLIKCLFGKSYYSTLFRVRATFD